MTFIFKHGIREYIASLANTESISPAHYNAYFGKALSKELTKHFQNRLPGSIIVAPDKGSVVLMTSLIEDDNHKFNKLILKTREILSVTESSPTSGSLKLIHLTWISFKRGDPKLLDNLYDGLHALLYSFNQQVPQNSTFTFQGISRMRSSANQNNRFILYSPVIPEQVAQASLMQQQLLKFFPKRFGFQFLPHLTIGRFKIKREVLENSWMQLESLWKNEKFTMTCDHFNCYRQQRFLFGLRIA